MPNSLPGVVRDAMAKIDHHIGLDHVEDTAITAAWFVVREALLCYSHDRQRLLIEMQDFRDNASIPHEEPVDNGDIRNQDQSV